MPKIHTMQIWYDSRGGDQLIDFVKKTATSVLISERGNNFL